ncbi:cyclin-dependent kinase 11B-like [Macrobrachium rosenbergii]|uniref:cyclin-dependent kinase 11B-like n=1 Tax=Macrobrachium rosenbergii TaxID=79674 RepID=UPI0034D4820A
MFSKLSLLVLVTLGAFVTSDKPDDGPLLSTFRGEHREVQRNPDGTYHFSFSLPQQERQEQRDADGKVTGYFAFVDNSGEEFSLHFDADKDGFQPESDGLPEAPEDTADVQNAREQFLQYYEQTARFLEELGSDEDSSSEEDGEYSDEDSSSEEDSDEEEEEEEEEEEDNGRFGFRASGRRQQEVSDLERSIFPEHFTVRRRS